MGGRAESMLKNKIQQVKILQEERAIVSEDD